MKKASSVNALSMDTEAHYREQAAYYRNSAAYREMKQLYPLLQTHIDYCQNEKLID